MSDSGVDIGGQITYQDDAEVDIDDDSGAGLDRRRYRVLHKDQVRRLRELLHRRVALRGRPPLHGGVGSPVLRLQLNDLLRQLRERLRQVGVPVRDVRLSGSSASFVIGMQPDQSYNDLDLLFSVDLSSQATLDTIKSAVLDSLRTYLPECERQPQPPPPPMESYIRKLVRILDSDRWSLISLGGSSDANSDEEDAECVSTVELKFVDQMRRQFEFTVDSFQIVLDEKDNENGDQRVLAESVSGSFAEAVCHLARREICTRCPEEIRGGGLLKYCRLLAEGYRPAPGIEPASLEKYMCSRFFIDFPEPDAQLGKIRGYLAAHFPGRASRTGQPDRRLDYLSILRSVVQSSTICLMQRERHSILRLIGLLAEEVRVSQRAISLEPFSSGADGWRAEQIVYGTGHFPWELLASLQTPQQQRKGERQRSGDVGGSGGGSGHRPLFGCILSTSSGNIAFNCLSSLVIIRQTGTSQSGGASL